MKVLIWFGSLSRRVIRLFSNTSNNLIHYSKVELGSGVGVMSEHEKPLWIKRDGVDVAVVISPELFEELVSAQEELDDIAVVDEAVKKAGKEPFAVLTNNKPSFYVIEPELFEALSELYFEMQATPLIKKRLARLNKAISVDIDDL